MKRLILLEITLFLFIALYPQSSKLSGDIIGTVNCVDYANGNSLTTTVNTAANLFDGDFNTFFATYVRTGGWAGLDLGEKHVITSVAFCPRTDWSSRLLLGLFEGANREDFLDAVPLCLIDETPQSAVLTTKAVDCSRGFRYVRYVGPNDVRCNIAELEFYGYKGEGNDTKFVQLTNLPTITIHTENAQDIVEKDVYLQGIVSVIYEDGTQIHTDGLDIKGRGNASWSFPKKPYRMKLNNKVNLMGLPAKEKNWTLINNYGDKTLMRNLLAFDLSRRLELAYTSVGVPVDVILNGEYKGCYQLCDQMEVAGGRVEVEKMEDTDTELPALSGGYLLEIDAYANTEISWFTSARNSTPVTVKYPKDDEIVPTQYQYIKNHFNLMESALYASNYTDQTNGYRKYLDVETFLRHFLVGELSGNTDTYWSVYMYKKRNDDIFYFGPVWDFDIAYENDSRTHPINNNPEWIYASSGSEAAGMKSFVNRLMSDQQFVNRLKAIYAEYRDKEILSAEKLTGVVDYYENELARSQQLNFTRWPILGSIVHQNYQALGSYEKEVDVVRTFIEERITWMDKKLSYTAASIKEESIPELSIYPGQDRIHIEGINSLSSIKVFDISGKIVNSFKTHTDCTVAVDRGIFIVQVSDEGSGKQQSAKCVVH